MNMLNHFAAITAERRTRLTRWVLAHRIRARHPSLLCDPTAIWDYAYRDIDAIQIGAAVTVSAFVEIVVYRSSPYSSIPGRLVLADHSVVAAGVNIRAAGGTIEIGARSVLSQHTVVVAANHQLSRDLPHLRSPWDETRTGVVVGRNVWVGASCVLLPGCRIGDNSVIAAGSVVRNEVPPGELWGGVPARRLRVL